MIANVGFGRGSSLRGRGFDLEWRDARHGGRLRASDSDPNQSMEVWMIGEEEVSLPP